MGALPKVHDYMDHEVTTVSPDTEIGEAVKLLLDRHVTGAPVVDADGRLLGILTEYDCLRLLTTEDDHHARVSDYMTTDVVTGSPDMDIYYAAGLFLRNRFRRLPILLGDKLVGAITRYDILRAIQDNLHLKA
jgi:CBS domain-containing protein